ncbi:hypothetical protein FQR65_LT16451 [Abscondita terminalis]|nr:hypothetical protein FQR65_LT16451 [Abscondita terminalis]
MEKSNNKLCIDIGGSSTKYLVLNSDLETMLEGTTGSYGKIINKTELFYKLNEIIKDVESKIDFQIICISTPGITDPKTTQVIGQSAILNLENSNFRKELKTSKPIFAENDAFCAGISQIKLFKSEKPLNAIVYVAGTGIGGCCVIDGKVHKGTHMFAGTIGFLDSYSLNPLETMGHTNGSASFLKHKYNSLNNTNKDAKEILDSIENDKSAKDLVEQLSNKIVKFLIDSCAITDPEYVLIEKMLGDGFYIRAKKEKELFKSPVDSGKLSLITETSHAFFFEVANNISILMHIGLDTVKLNGKPFKVKTKINENVNIKSDIVEVDISEINNSGLDHVCPITIDSGNLEFNFNLLAKDKNIKQGDLIGEFVHLQNKVEKQEKNAVQDIKEYFLADSAMAKEANKINEYVGTINNYSEVYNCMTRLRFKIKNKDLVNIEKIRSEVYKMKEEIILDNEKRLGQFSLKSTKHLTPFRRLLQMFGGIMAQIIPVFIGFGVIQAIVGIMIAVAATKYFELRMPIGVGLGIVICSPLLFASGGLMGMGGE